MPFLRRLALAPAVLVAVAAITYAVPRILRPDIYPDELLVAGVARDLERVFLHNGLRVLGDPAGLSGDPRSVVRGAPDFPLLCALGLWTAVLLIVLGLLFDGVVSLIDPHVRTSTEQAW